MRAPIARRTHPTRSARAGGSLTAIPIDFGPDDVERLAKAGLDDLAILDVINAASFFNWANRLMLSLGEPTHAA